MLMYILYIEHVKGEGTSIMFRGMEAEVTEAPIDNCFSPIRLDSSSRGSKEWHDISLLIIPLVLFSNFN
jgi:hypothetical protein